MFEYLTSGVLLGLGAGLAPGPLLVLVISETLKYNIRAGIKVSITPIITDLPIILLTLLILSKLSNFILVLGFISIFGGFFVLYLGYESFKTKGIKIDTESVAPQSIRKGVITNALNPHPYLFWFSVGSPFIMKSLYTNISYAIAFILGFYLLLVSSKISLAIIVGKSRSFLEGKIYIYIMRLLGILLFIFSLLLFRDGLEFFGFLK